MSFPNLPENIGPIDVNLTPEEVAILLLASIAFEELGLAHIINSEGEKLQRAIGTLADPTTEDGYFPPLATTLAELLSVNRSVDRTLQTIIKKEMLLQFKFENILDFLGTTTTTTTTTTTEAPPPTTVACDCSANLIDLAPTQVPSVITVFPPLAVVTPNTLEIEADLCSDCTPGGNNFFYEFIRPANPPTVPAPFRQTFTATTFNITCDPTNSIMTVTGQGAADGVGPGHISGPVPANYTLLLDETTDTLTLILTRGPNTYTGVHSLSGIVDIVINDCPLP